MKQIEYTSSPLLSFPGLSVMLMRVCICVDLEEPGFIEMSSVLGDSFLNELDESYFEAIPEPETPHEFETLDRKRKWDLDYDKYESISSSHEMSSNDILLDELAPISPAYDIERVTLLPERKRRRTVSENVRYESNPTFSNWDAHTDDSWDILPTFEDMESKPIVDSWDMSPIKSFVSTPFAFTSPQSMRNPIGNILSNGIHTFETEKSSPKYVCRACGKNLKGHQHTPTMHFMLPKHEKCWHQIAADANLSLDTTKKLYPPQFMKRTTKKGEFVCEKCGQSGSKRRILSHVMGAKCKELRDEYSRTMAWNGIEDTHNS